MAGYNHRRGMSNNALKAYRRNLKPISRFTAQDLRHANIEISLAFARWLAKASSGPPPTGITRRNTTTRSTSIT